MSIKVSELTTQTPISTDNLLLESGAHGTSKATISKILEAGLDALGIKGFTGLNTPEFHNCLYRGKEHTVEALSAKVQGNDFSDIFIGDYFKVSFTTDYGTVTNQKCLIAGINYFKNCGSSNTTTPHLVMIPETYFGTASMNDTNVTTGGYVGSKMHTTVLPAIASALKSAIGSSHLISQSRLLSNDTNNNIPSAGAGLNGASTGWASTDCDLCLMSEPMVCGGTVLSSSFYDVGDRKQQLPIFALNPQIANILYVYWLSAVVDSTTFADINENGRLGRDIAGTTAAVRVRPYFLFH